MIDTTLEKIKLCMCCGMPRATGGYALCSIHLKQANEDVHAYELRRSAMDFDQHDPGDEDRS